MAMQKNQAAIDAGRYEIENQQFYHPNDYRQQPEPPNQQHPMNTSQSHNSPVPRNDGLGSSWNVTSGAEKDRGRQSGRSRFGSLFNKATGGSSSQVGEEDVEPRLVPERAKLRKRSTSGQGNPRHPGGKLGIVGE